MSATTLDPITALVVIDLQQGIAALLGAHPMDAVIDNAALLAAAFRRHGLPVALVTVSGRAPGRTEQAFVSGQPPAPDWMALLPQLDRQPQDIVVTKRTWGAFASTDLEAQLKVRGVTQVVLAGVSTSAGVESSAREAHALGFNVTLAIDAMTDMRADTHANSVERIFPRLGETDTTQAIIALLGLTQRA